jgi:hypothetical protein
LIASCSQRWTAAEKRRAIELIEGRPIESLFATGSLWRYCPHPPWPRQQAFLELAGLEAFYGGAAGGGKSEALLMAALMYVHQPGYAALILRKDTQRLSLSGGLIPRSHEWLTGPHVVPQFGRTPVWQGRERRWQFETGAAPATISFGYLKDAGDKYRYGSSEYQFIAFDELTEFPEEDYLFLFSRLRKTRDLPVPLRMRAASNPGNIGHGWVKRRFIPQDFSQTAELSGVLYHEDRAFVPARIADNPAVDQEAYLHSLRHLPRLLRLRLMDGDWSVREEGLISHAWLREYDECGDRLQLYRQDGSLLSEVPVADCRRIATIDPAGTSADRAQERRGRSPSYTVIQVWDIAPGDAAGPLLMLRHVFRDRVGFDGLCRAISQVHSDWRPACLLIEHEKLGQAAN